MGQCDLACVDVVVGVWQIRTCTVHLLRYLSLQMHRSIRGWATKSWKISTFRISVAGGCEENIARLAICNEVWPIGPNLAPKILSENIVLTSTICTRMFKACSSVHIYFPHLIDIFSWNYSSSTVELY